MIAASVDKKQIRKTGLIIIAVALLALIVVYASGRLLDARPDAASALPTGESAEAREEYLASLGFTLDTKSSLTEVMVPKEFDERFDEYNEMLKTCGFDLEPLRGQTMKKCVYTVTNAPKDDGKVSAVLLVHDGSIVAGHLLCEGETTAIKPLFAPAPQEDTTSQTQEPEAQ